MVLVTSVFGNKYLLDNLGGAQRSKGIILQIDIIRPTKIFSLDSVLRARIIAAAKLMVRNLEEVDIYI